MGNLFLNILAGGIKNDVFFPFCFSSRQVFLLLNDYHSCWTALKTHP